MSETQVLLSRIAALRQQLEQVQGLTPAAGVEEGAPATGRLGRLERQVAAGAQQTVFLDRTLRQLTPAASMTEGATFPKLLTARARRILEQGRELLGHLRALGNEFEGQAPTDDPLAERYAETTAMADTALRMVQAFPDAPSAQLRLCEGLEAILVVIGERVAALTAGAEERRRERHAIDMLANVLNDLAHGVAIDLRAVATLAESVVAEAQDGEALRFRGLASEEPGRLVAHHSLTVARVMARVVRGAPEFRGKSQELILAALVHDVGMLCIPQDIHGHKGPLNDDQRRAVEAHTRTGADLLTRLLPGSAALAEAAARHHERLNGTGYPGGLREMQISPVARLLAVCDVYAALAMPRPYRPALEPRTALTDTLLLAEQGLLDRYHAERLLQLSFYPIGSVVELANGAIAVVVATHLGRRDLNSPARPVVALLTNSLGEPLPLLRHLDLAQSESHSIVRALPANERLQMLGKRHPELV